MRTLIFWIGTALISLTARAAVGAEVFLMHIPGVTGDVTLQGYTGWISVGSFSAGFTGPPGGPGPGGVPPKATGSCQSVVVTKLLDVTSPELSLAVFRDTPFPTVVLAALRQTDVGYFEFLRFTLTHAPIRSLTFAGDSATSAQSEVLTLGPDTIEVTYAAQAAASGSSGKGTVSTTLNCITGAAN